MAAAIDHGYLPAGRYVLNHDIMHCTADGVAGNHLYSGRALGMSEPWDYIQMHQDLEPMWPDIRAHYRKIGLKHSENVIWHLHFSALGEHIEYQPSVFYFGPNQCRFWGDHDWLEAVEFINSKNNFIELAEEVGVDVPKTLCFDRPSDVIEVDLSAIQFPCYAKAAISVSGVGIYRCENLDQLMNALTRYDDDMPIQIQEGIEAVSFLNIQYRVLGKHLVRLAISEQILDGFSHQGNRVPASHEPWGSVEPMAHWLVDHGMKGIFAFDVAVVQTERGLRFTAIECNPRFNGATYPTAIAHKLDIPEWSAVTMKTSHRTLSTIDLSGIEFDPKSGVGVIIVNWGTVLVGKLLMMIAGSPAQQQALRLELESRL